jgi:hypothetical protein
MILYPHPPGTVAIPQSSHAFLAFQLADHWGNRGTPRPTPRADVLAAALLHDAGWDDAEEPPRLASDGSPLAFDTLPEDEREAIWASAVTRASLRGRYVAYLVSHHVSHLAAVYSSGAHREFLASQEKIRAGFREALAGDRRYERAWRGGADETNRAVVRLADAIAVHLSRGTSGSSTLPGLPQRGALVDLAMEEIGERTYRLRPWPLLGRSLSLTAEGRLLPRSRFSDERELRRAWEDAGVVRLDWRLLSPAQRVD